MKFLDLFPPPGYMTLAQAGVSIDDRSIRYISLNPFRHGEVALNDGAVSGGTILNKTSFVQALGRLKEAGLEFVSASIPEDKAYLFTTHVESSTYKDMADAVAFTIEENAPVKLSSSVFSFEYVNDPEESGIGTEVLVTVLPADVAKTWSEAFAAAGLHLISMDLRSEAVSRTLTMPNDARLHFIIDLGEVKTGLYLVENGLVHFSSSVAASLAANDMQLLDMLKAEIRKVFLFTKDKKIEHITLIGASAANEAAVAMLLADVDTPYSVGNVWANIPRFKKHLPEMAFEESLKYAAAVGSALPPTRHIYV